MIEQDHFDLNASLKILDENGSLQLYKDKEALKHYFLNDVNQNTVFFHSLEEKLEYLVKESYYEEDVIKQYSFEFIKKLFKKAYEIKFRFKSFVGAYKYYQSYTLKTFDGSRFLERYEDRVCMNSLYLARGDEKLALSIMEEVISNRFQPATPTFLNSSKASRGELVSCFLLRIEDNMESISRSINAALQLSKRGGGVAFTLTNIREKGSPIKKIKGQSSGIIPIMKLFEDAFSYANQLGARAGAGAVYLNAHHPDIMDFLDTKRENADEKMRIKTLSLGVTIPDITFELAKNNEDMYLFSPYDVERVYGKPMADLSVTTLYREMVDNPDISKKKISARLFFQTLAELEFESGYPYIMFEDTVNGANPIDGRINMSNLCSEILQTNTPSEYNEDLSFKTIGKDISCNLGSMNVALSMESPNLSKTVEVAIRSLTSVSDLSNISCVPSIEKGNNDSHAIGLGQMNLHGFFAKEKIHYGSDVSIDFTNIYFYTIAYHAYKASCLIAKERKKTFKGFEKSKYATGEYFEKYTMADEIKPKTKKVVSIFKKYDIDIPTQEDWVKLVKDIKKHGLYHAYLQAVPPTGSISYINNSTASIHPIVDKIEVRKEGKLGRVYYPAPFLSDSTIEYYKTAYEIGYEAIIDVYAEATKHVDQGLSLTLFFTDKATTRDINKAQIYAWKKGIKTLYYIRIKQDALEGTEVDSIESCTSCTL